MQQGEKLQACTIRKSTKQDYQSILLIYQSAREYFKSQGLNIWQAQYPSAGLIEDDINKGQSYVIEVEGKVVAIAVILAVLEGEDEEYNHFEEGKWITQGNKYVTIHRVAISNEYKKLGLATRFFKYAEQFCKQLKIQSIRVDAYEGNIAAQQLFKKNGYTYCGVIRVEKIKRNFAFEKIIS